MTQCKIITITQQKGGTGKTTLAAHISVALAQQGYRIGLIDIDPQKNLEKWYQLREKTLGKVKAGLSFRAISEWQLFSVVDAFKADHDFIIIDTYSQPVSDTRSAIRVADLVLVPLQPSPADLWSTGATIDAVKQERIPHRIILNRVLDDSQIVQQIEGNFSDLIAAKITNSTSLIEPMEQGLTACEVKGHSDAKKAMVTLANDILKLLAPAAVEVESYLLEAEEDMEKIPALV